MNKGNKFSTGLTFLCLAVMLLCSPAIASDSGSPHSHAVQKAVLNLNTATSSEIAQIINAIANMDLCHKITHYRMVNKGFKTIEELNQVEGVTKDMYKKIINNVSLEI